MRKRLAARTVGRAMEDDLLVEFAHCIAERSKLRPLPTGQCRGLR
jgi:hypothetical protein